jgi:hypothetical protein
LPVPSQVEAGVATAVAAAQLAPMQVVPARYFWQAPLPSQWPLLPQDAAPASLQVFCGSVAPTATLVQVPSEVVSAQDWQAPVQALLQQIPCAQNPLRHWAAVAQEAPWFSRPQVFLVPQLYVDAHWALVEQTLKHWVPLQAYGMQARESGATHRLFALQVEGGV